jgi:hypothetical protein
MRSNQTSRYALAGVVAWGLASVAVLTTPVLANAAPAGAPTPSNERYGDPAHADLSGMWNSELFLIFSGQGPLSGAGGPPPGAAPAGPPGGPPGGGRGARPAGPSFTPAYAAKFAEYQKRLAAGDPIADTVTRCLAFGTPRFMTMPMEVLQTPGQITLNLGVLHDIRRIYLDGRGHTPDADPSYNGDSVGHWEGDTLVVDTIGIRGSAIDVNGIPFSDKLTVTERFRRVTPTRLEVIQTMTDPEAFTAPYTVTRNYGLAPPGSRFEEYICENNKDN